MFNVIFGNFQIADAAELALELDGNTLKKRNIVVRRHKPSAKPSSEKSPSEMLVRHKGKQELDKKNKRQVDALEIKRRAKKEKRRMRREGEKLLGIFKQRTTKNDVCEDVIPESNDSGESKIRIQTVDSKQFGKSKFLGQTVESAKKKKVCYKTFIQRVFWIIIKVIISLNFFSSSEKGQQR